MTRIAFITLFLGLTLSQQRVEVSVTGPAARVELLLDGKVVAALSKAPWSATVDFGDHLRPRRLVARALGSDGAELGRAEQKVNLPHAAAETTIVLERDDAGTPRAARLLWHSLEGEAPKRVELLLDSRSVPVAADLRAKLPPLDNAQPHLLRARLVSKLGVFSDSEIAFGGGLEDATSAELTAAVIRLRDPNQRVTVADAQQWLTVRGAPPNVAGVEDMKGEVIVVRHPVQTETAVRLDPAGRDARRRLGVSDAVVASGSTNASDVVRFVWPLVVPAGKADLFPPSRSYAFKNADEFKKMITDFGYAASPKELRYADAVAVAGIQSLSGRRPRAVVLLLGDAPNDSSRLRPQQTREYLQAAGVPLHVWTLGHVDGLEAWGGVEDITSLHGFSAAFDALRRDLESQRIVWLRGDFLPDEVQLTDAGARVIVLAGMESASPR